TPPRTPPWPRRGYRPPRRSGRPSARACLFDHLVGADAQREWDGKAERLRSLKIDEKLDLRRLLDRQIGRFLALENPAGIGAHEAVGVRKAVAIADQAAGHGILAKRIHRGHRVARSQRHELLGAAVEEWVAADHQRADPQLGQGREYRVEVAFGAGVKDV